jgi:hypothetical protein
VSFSHLVPVFFSTFTASRPRLISDFSIFFTALRLSTRSTTRILPSATIPVGSRTGATSVRTTTVASPSRSSSLLRRRCRTVSASVESMATVPVPFVVSFSSSPHSHSSTLLTIPSHSAIAPNGGCLSTPATFGYVSLVGRYESACDSISLDGYRSGSTAGYLNVYYRQYTATECVYTRLLCMSFADETDMSSSLPSAASSLQRSSSHRHRVSSCPSAVLQDCLLTLVEITGTPQLLNFPSSHPNPHRRTSHPGIPSVVRSPFVSLPSRHVV